MFHELNDKDCIKLESLLFIEIFSNDILIARKTIIYSDVCVMGKISVMETCLTKQVLTFPL